MDDHSRRSSAEGQMGRCTRRPGSCQIFLISPALCFQASLCFAIAFKLLPYLPKGIVPMFTDVAINQCPYLHITNNISFSTFSLQNCWNFSAPSQFTRKMENLSYTFSAKIFLNWKKKTAQAGERDEETETVESTPRVLLLIQTPSTSE